MVLDDALPAGLEAVDLSLRTVAHSRARAPPTARPPRARDEIGRRVVGLRQLGRRLVVAIRPQARCATTAWSTSPPCSGRAPIRRAIWRALRRRACSSGRRRTRRRCTTPRCSAESDGGVFTVDGGGAVSAGPAACFERSAQRAAEPRSRWRRARVWVDAAAAGRTAYGSTRRPAFGLAGPRPASAPLRRARAGRQPPPLGAAGRDGSRSHRGVPCGRGPPLLPSIAGVDLRALARAARAELRAPAACVSGGSTITMQLARLLRPIAAHVARQGGTDPLGAPARAPARQADDSRAVPQSGAAGPGRGRRGRRGRALLRRLAPTS